MGKMVPKPVQRARRLIKKYGYNSPDEIDLIELLYAENLALKYETTDAYQGKIVFNKHTGIITLNLNLENEYQKRYVIAHEMGHFFNDKLGVMSDELGEKNKLGLVLKWVDKKERRPNENKRKNTLQIQFSVQAKSCIRD